MPFIISYTFFTLIVLIVMNVFLVRKKNWHTKKEEALDKEVPVGKVLFVLMFGMFIAILNQRFGTASLHTAKGTRVCWIGRRSVF